MEGKEFLSKENTECIKMRDETGEVSTTSIEVNATSEVSTTSTEVNAMSEVGTTSTEVNTSENLADKPSTSRDDSKRRSKTQSWQKTSSSDKCEHSSKNEDSDGNCQKEAGAFEQFLQNKRTFSPRDLSVAEHPEDWNHDSETENKDEACDQGINLDKSKEVSAAWTRDGRRMKLAAAERNINSDGELARIMSYCSEIDQVDERSRATQQNSENSGMKSSTDCESEILSSRISEDATKANYERTSPTETESSYPELNRLLQADKSKSLDESTSADETSSIKSVISPKINVRKSKPHKGNTSGTKTGYHLEESPLTDAEKSKYLPEFTLGADTSSSENSEISRIIDSNATTSSLEYTSDTETTSSSRLSDICSADNDQSQSPPPKLTSEPRSEDSGVFKVPPLKKESVQTLKDSPNSSNRVNSEGNRPGSNSKRPNDLNVKARSEFYSFNDSSPTNLVRQYRSLPNISIVPRNPITRRSMGSGASQSGVVRSLFTGNFISDQSTSSGAAISNKTSESSQNCGCNRELRRNRNTERVSENTSGSSSEVTCSKSKACRKLTFTPPDRETNVNETLKGGDSWFEKFGDISGLQLQEVQPTPDGSSREDKIPKRKTTTPEIPECSSSKKPRPSFVSDSQSICEGTKELEQVEPSPAKEKPKGLLQLPSHDSQNTSPKRKADDLEGSCSSEASFSDGPKQDESSESAVKRKKLKPPTPLDKTEVSDSLSDQDTNADSEEE